MTTLPQHTALRIIGIAFAIAVGVVCSAGRVSAECGDYVHIIAPSQPVESKPSRPEQAQPDESAEHKTPSKPCNGPGCSSRHPPPATPIAPLTPPTDSKGSACPASGDVSDPATGIRPSFPSTEPGVAIHCPNSIFHPPRID